MTDYAMATWPEVFATLRAGGPRELGVAENSMGLREGRGLPRRRGECRRGRILSASVPVSVSRRPTRRRGCRRRGRSWPR
ncbi:hypothetical protein CVT30_33715 [Streptomyces sp. AMCC400023]|nr:hypothetical protein CVT30_33715 [Streptomyces sp. AMCC400023]